MMKYGKFLELKDTRLVVKRVRSLLRKMKDVRDAMKTIGLTRTHKVVVLPDRKEVWGQLRLVAKLVEIHRVPVGSLAKYVKKVEGKKTLTAKEGDGIELVSYTGPEPRLIVPEEFITTLDEGPKGDRKVIDVESTVLSGNMDDQEPEAGKPGSTSA